MPGSTIVSLQTVTGVFWTDPRIYNGVAWLVLAPLILLWVIKSTGSGLHGPRAWVALAAIVPLSMLAGCHRQYDTRLLVLALPACAILAARKDRIGKLAVVFTSIAAVASSNLVLPMFEFLSNGLRNRVPGVPGELLYALLGRPVPPALLTMGAFYCWLLLRSDHVLGIGPVAAPTESIPVIPIETAPPVPTS